MSEEPSPVVRSRLMSTAARLFGWAGVVLAVASLGSGQVLGPKLSDPANRNLEWLIILPLGLGALAVLMLAVAMSIVLLGALWRWWRRFAYPPPETRPGR